MRCVPEERPYFTPLPYVISQIEHLAFSELCPALRNDVWERLLGPQVAIHCDHTEIELVAKAFDQVGHADDGAYGPVTREIICNEDHYDRLRFQMRYPQDATCASH